MRARRVTVVLALALALAACATAPRRDDVARAQLQFAHQLAAQRSWSELLVCIERVHARGLRTAETLTLRAAAYRGQRAIDEAERDLRAALSLDRRYAPAHAALAVLLDVKGVPAEADAHYREALTLARDNPAYLNDWGFSLYRRGRMTEAIGALRRATELAPLVGRFRNNLGFAYARAGDFARAEQQFLLGGSAAEASNNLGFAYENAGNLAQAFDAYVAAVRLDPGLDPARHNLAHTAKRLDRAIPSDLASPPGMHDERSTQ